MQRSTTRTLLLALGAICLLAQSAFALPECRCDEVATTPPCHEPAPPERSACCDPGDAPATSGGCASGLQSTCCSAAAPSATETAAVTMDSGQASTPAPAPEFTPAPRTAVAPIAPDAPDPPGQPTWLLHSALLN